MYEEKDKIITGLAYSKINQLYYDYNKTYNFIGSLVKGNCYEIFLTLYYLY